MRWAVVGGFTLAAVVAAAAFGWNDVRRERDFRRLLAEGDQAMAARQASVALEHFSGAVALKPAAMVPYLKRGDAYLHRQDWAAAERDLRTAAALDPSAPQPPERLGDAALAAGRFGDAAEHFRASLAIEDRAPRVLYKLALAQYRGGDAAGAITSANSALAFDDTRPETHYVKGLALAATGRLEAARVSLERSVALAPASTAPRLALADVFAAAGQTREELAMRESVAALDTAGPDALLRVARAYAAHDRPDLALASLTRASDQHPAADVVRLTRARVLLDQASLTPSAAGLAEALDLAGPIAARPDASSDALTLYGRALLLDGSLAAAEQVLTRATTRYPVAPNAFALLSEAAARRGHRADAIDAAAKHAALSAGLSAGQPR